ncbi:hypothetical protein EV182_001937 [Spiromyces aspiralis]|uniref:Uncharacterized protein n=1 Tax=Spiromyces aspiralis TaxID=68401 RepID=A0ACC1HSS3_9FUNG|nr:hypothetical protein EV182_001937 [Spiromyces aspiralis]
MAIASAKIDISDIAIITTVVMGVLTFLLRKPLSKVLLSSLTGVKGGPASLEVKKKDGNDSKTAEAPKELDPERDFVKKMREGNKNVVIIFGSQTGTAEDFANRLAREAHAKGLRPIVFDPENYDYQHLSKLRKGQEVLVWILATTGEGEPTDNMHAWYEAMVPDPEDLENCEVAEFADIDGVEFDRPLANVAYLGFGLGNTTYEQFCAHMRHINSRMKALGAKQLMPCGEGDDDANLEEDFTNWKAKIWPIICEHLQVGPSQGGADLTNDSGSTEPELEWQVEEVEEVGDDSAAQALRRGEMTVKSIDVHDAKHPYMASIPTAYDLSPTGERHVLHLEVNIGGSGMKYRTGDHLAVWPTNREEEVQQLLEALSLSAKADSAIKVTNTDPHAASAYLFPSSTTTYGAALRHYLDITSPPARDQISMFVLPYAKSSVARDLLTQLAEDKQAYAQGVVGKALTLSGLLAEVRLAEQLAGVNENERLVLPFAALLSLCSRLQPRYYSISSSGTTSPERPSITAVVLRYQPEGDAQNWRYGVATNYLSTITNYVNNKHTSRSGGIYGGVMASEPAGSAHSVTHLLFSDAEQTSQVRVPVHVRTSSFRLPADHTVPVVMIGPGTGVAPFRGFIQERIHQQATGATVLFFGARHYEHDYLYKAEFETQFAQLAQYNPESAIVTAFSRDQPHKIYVQHRLRERADMVWKWLNDLQGYFYVCGEARFMARDVKDALVQIAQSEGGLGLSDAESWVGSLKKFGRYQEDVWA